MCLRIWGEGLAGVAGVGVCCASGKVRRADLDSMTTVRLGTQFIPVNFNSVQNYTEDAFNLSRSHGHTLLTQKITCLQHKGPHQIIICTYRHLGTLRLLCSGCSMPFKVEMDGKMAPMKHQ